MEYSGEGVSVYAEAKGEYTRQLCQYLAPSLQKYFLELMDLAKEREKEPKKHLVSFQTLLEAISEWNVDKVQRETQAIAIGTQCDYLEELLTAVFIAHTKVLSAIRLTNRQKKLQITIPKLEHFLHRTLTECARLLWSNTYLFASTGTSLERQKNMRQIETLITEGILQGVRTMLPVKSILREYLTTESDTEAEEEDEEEGDGEAETDAPAPLPVVATTEAPDLPGPTGASELDATPLESTDTGTGPTGTTEEVVDAAPLLDVESVLGDASEEVPVVEETPLVEEDPTTKTIPLSTRPASSKQIVSVQKGYAPPSPKVVPTIHLEEEKPHVTFADETTVFDETAATGQLAADLEDASADIPMEQADETHPIEESAPPGEEGSELDFEFEELAA